MRTPRALSQQMTARPTGPQPSTIATSFVDTSPRLTACSATAMGSVRAATSGASPLGTTKDSDCSASTCSAYPPGASGESPVGCTSPSTPQQREDRDLGALAELLARAAAPLAHLADELVAHHRGRRAAHELAVVELDHHLGEVVAVLAGVQVGAADAAAQHVRAPAGPWPASGRAARRQTASRRRRPPPSSDSPHVPIMCEARRTVSSCQRWPGSSTRGWWRPTGPRRWRRSTTGSAGWAQFLREELAAGRRLPARRRPASSARSSGRWPTSGCSSSARTRTRRPATRSGLSFAVDAARLAAAEEPGQHLPGAAQRPRRHAARGTATSAAWADQGVMLLNRVLTVRPGESGLAPRPRLGGGHRAGDHRAGASAAAPCVGDPLGPRRPVAEADARPGPLGRVGAPVARSRRTAASSAPGRSAGSTGCSRSRAARRWTGRASVTSEYS